MRYIATTFLLIAFAVNHVTAASISYPIGIVRFPDERPLAVILEIDPGSGLVFQLDTGSPSNVIYSNPPKSSKQVKVIAPTENTKSLYKDFVVQDIGDVVPTISGIAGLPFFITNVAELNFFTNTLVKIDNPTPGLEDLPSYFIGRPDGRLDRLMINVCGNGCEDMIFDTGIAFADVVRFMPMTELSKLDSETTQLPGLQGDVICTKPTRTSTGYRVGMIALGRIYEASCAFIRDSNKFPSKPIFGIRSMIDRQMLIKFYPKNSKISFEQGK